MKLEIRNWSRPTHAYKPGMPVFVRYGLWGSDWSSRGHSFNHGTGEREQGLSVYRGKLVDGAVELHDTEYIPQRYKEELSGRFAFPVTGEVIGQGSDGEPVLRAVKLLRLPLGLSVRVAAPNNVDAT